MKYDELTALGAVELADAVGRREISAREAVDCYLASADNNENRINAFITRTTDEALKSAEAVDSLIREGARLPLAGVTVAVKDNIAVKNVKMTCASGILKDYVPGYSSTVWDRLCEAGAVLVGKSNMDEFAMGSSTERSIVGATHNPINTDYCAGGSSGGSAAAVAGKEALIAIGTDTGGSSRQPASFCGIVSVKPTYGLVSRYGVTEFASSLDTVCPIARDVRDAARVLSVIAGNDPRDMTSFGEKCDYSEEIGMSVAGMKACVPHSATLLDGESGAVFERALRTLEKIGVEVEFLAPEAIPSDELLRDVYLVIVSAESSSCLARFDGIRYGTGSKESSFMEMMKESRAYFGDEVNRRITAGIYALTSGYGGGYYTSVGAIRKKLTDDCEKLFNKYDFIVTPTTSHTAEKLNRKYTSAEEAYLCDIFDAYANLTGCPAVTVPSGIVSGLPLGLMLTGRKRSEKRLLRASYATQESLACFLKGGAEDERQV